MTNKQTKKAKRPLQTSLGKAPGQNDKEEVDLSHVRKPLETSIYGLHQVLSLLQTATDEVKSYVTYECDIMYECRICRSIFRSLANFILHKRNYCHEKFKPYASKCRDGKLLEKLTPPEPPEGKDIYSVDISGISQVQKKESKGKSLTPVIEKLKDKQEIKQLTQELLATDLSSSNKSEEKTLIMTESDLLLEEIATNNAAVFQTVLQSIPQGDISKTELMKSEVMEIHGILNNDEAVLGSDGKVCNFQTNKLKANQNGSKNKLTCTECNMKFSTKKTLTFHLKNKHNNTRQVYVCPDCKDTFANAWCVFRHLIKVHRKTLPQVKKLREQVHNSAIRKDQDTNKKNVKKDCSNLDKADEENQWLNNIEGDKDFQMCGGCGKRFERKAALHSHAAMCVKRIAVCNTIKENNAKKKEEGSKDIKNKSTNTSKSEKSNNIESTETKGASKRKPYLLRTYKQSLNNKISEIPEKSRDPNRSTTCDSKSVPAVSVSDIQVNKQVPECEKSKFRKSNIGGEHKLSDCDKEKKLNVCDVDHRNNQDVIEGCTANDIHKVLDMIRDDDFKKSSDDTVLDKKSSGKTFKEKEYLCTSLTNISNEKMFEIIGCTQNKIEFIKEEVVSPPCDSQPDCSTAKDLDIFCEKVSERLVKIEDAIHKTTTSSSLETSTFIKSQDDDKTVPDFVNPGRIFIKNLDELKGFSKELEPSETSDTEMPVLEPSVSPKSARKPAKQLVKRKRTSSLDSERSHKMFKQSKFEILLDKQDLNFMAKASPYMDRTNLLCKSCHLKQPSLSKLLWHMSAHFSWFRFQCSRCSFVSFGKTECSDHAKEVHYIKNAEISSVVLPIPNWKTLLMSNEFKELKNDDEFGGKLTDEVKPCFQNEAPLTDNNENIPSKNLIDTLFIDSEAENVDFVDMSEVQTFPMPILNQVSCPKNQSIDVTNNEQENFQLEVPQEIYTLDVFEVINIDENIDGRRTVVKNENFVLPNCSTEIPGLSDVKLECGELKNSSSSSLVNNRPTRNRMRSIKTLQDDFLYDLGKVTMQNDAVTKANGPQKHKKNHNSSNVQKKEKEIRVYTKNK